MKSAFFRNAVVFALDGAFCRQLRRGVTVLETLEDRRFQEGTAGATGVGWVPPTKFDDALSYSVKGCTLIVLRVERKVLPGAVVKREAEKRYKAFEEREGFMPGRKMRKEITELVRDELMAKAPSVFRDTRVLLDHQANRMLIDTASRTMADTVIGMIARTFDQVPVETLYTESSPSSCMMDWLVEEAPDDFSIDQDAEFKASTGATAKYKALSLTNDIIADHIRNDRACVRLGMTWADRISFALTDSMTLKAIKPLDVINESPIDDAMDEQTRFESDFYLFSSEIRKLLDSLIDALGGVADDL